MAKKKIAEKDKAQSASRYLAGLRKKAEDTLRAEDVPKKLSPEEILQVLHELRVHQVELEMQNEELRRAQSELDAARARYFDLYDLAPVGYCTVSEQGLILEANLTAAGLLDVPRGSLARQPLSRFILKEDQDTYYRHRKQLFETGEAQTCELRLAKNDGTVFWARLEATVAQDDNQIPVCRVVISDISMRKRAEEVQAHLVAELEKALAKVKTLSGLLPICAGCKKIRDDQGYWGQVEVYITEHSEAHFTHSMCPECMKKYYPEKISK